MTQWIGWLRRLPGTTSALVSVLATEGAAPCGAGTRMLVTTGDQLGTIGGGELERLVLEQARTLLTLPPGNWRVEDYPLGSRLDACCGGRMRVLIEHLDPGDLDWLHDAEPWHMLVTTLEKTRVERAVFRRETATRQSARGELPGAGTRMVEPLGRRPRPFYLFGAGHIGRAIARHTIGLPLQLAWFDTRPESAEIDGVTAIPEEQIAKCLEEAPDDAAVAILTHDHSLDYGLALAALTRAPLAFVGLIGSSTKIARVRARLLAEGVSEDALARLTAPIGLPGVTGSEPDVIAIAVLAQVLQLNA